MHQAYETGRKAKIRNGEYKCKDDEGGDSGCGDGRGQTVDVELPLRVTVRESL